MSEFRPSDVSCDRVVGETILALERLLREHYGVDYAFTVAGVGQNLAASTMQHGRVTPRFKCSRTVCERFADPRCLHKHLRQHYCLPCAAQINRFNGGECFDNLPTESADVRGNPGDGPDGPAATAP